MALAIQSKGWRHTQRDPAWKRPHQYWCDVMGGLVEPEFMARAEPSIHLGAGAEVLATESARAWQRGQAKRPADADGISEFPRRACDVLLGNKVFGNVPALKIARQNELGFHFALPLAASFRI